MWKILILIIKDATEETIRAPGSHSTKSTLTARLETIKDVYRKAVHIRSVLIIGIRYFKILILS